MKKYRVILSTFPISKIVYIRARSLENAYKNARKQFGTKYVELIEKI